MGRVTTWGLRSCSRQTPSHSARITSNCGIPQTFHLTQVWDKKLAVHGAKVAAGQGGTANLLHPPLPLAGASIAMERGRQQN